MGEGVDKDRFPGTPLHTLSQGTCALTRTEETQTAYYIQYTCISNDVHFELPDANAPPLLLNRNHLLYIFHDRGEVLSSIIATEVSAENLVDHYFVVYW